MTFASNSFARVPVSIRHAGMRRIRARASFLVCALLAGCASTRLETSGSRPAASLCQAQGENLSALVLWGPLWRPDQKDVPLREGAALRGLENFFASSGCFGRFEIRRLPGGGSAVVPDQRELLSVASTVDRVVVVTVRELGPVVKLLSPAALVEGGTEVVLGITAIDARTGASLADIS